MNEITTTAASGRGRGCRSRRLRRLAIGVAGAASALVLGAGASVGVFASAASADVNYQYPTWATTTLSNCRINIGDQWSPQSYAIGDTTVKCSSYHNIAVYTELYRNGALVDTSTNPYSYFPNTSYVHDVPTAPYRCGGSATWYTASWVSIDGSAWRGWTSPPSGWTPACP